MSTSNAAARPTTRSDLSFAFVPVTQTEAATGRGTAKQVVRAHVTRVQHAKYRAVNSPYRLQSWTVKPYVHPSITETSRRSNTEKQKKPRHRPFKQPSSGPDASEIGPSTRSVGVQSGVALATPALPAGGSKQDPFWSYPVDYQPELAPIFAHYIENLAIDIPDIDGPIERGLLRHIWFPMCMTDASSMYAVLLMSASHYSSLHPSRANIIDLLALKTRALAEINAAMADPMRATSETLIGAVAKMAAYEAVFGDSRVFRAHMDGLRLMLRIRGDTRGLGPKGFLERLLVWIDFNAVHLIGGERIFGGDSGILTEVVIEEPDPWNFAGIQ